VQNKNDPQNLLGDLESIRRLLHEEAAAGQTNAPEKIPILLEAVANVIPTLKEIVDAPFADEVISANTSTPTEFDNALSQPATHKTESQLRLEGEELIDNLIEEYVPIMESRLREQLRLRLDFIIKEQMRKYR
jgi:hypothetical protein